MKNLEKIRQIETLIRELRDNTGEPFSLRVGSKTFVELSPFNHDDRVTVTHKELGATTINYTSEGVIVDILGNEDVDFLHTVGIPRDDLCVDEEI